MVEQGPAPAAQAAAQAAQAAGPPKPVVVRPKVGRIVLYNPPGEAEKFAALIVGVQEVRKNPPVVEVDGKLVKQGETEIIYLVNLTVFPDSYNYPAHVRGVLYDAAGKIPGSWSWPAKD